MKKEELIEELKKIEGVGIINSVKYEGVYLCATDRKIFYYSKLDTVLIWTQETEGDKGEFADEFEFELYNLEPETILDLFRKWK